MIFEQTVAFIVLFNITHLYGIFENRLFYEAGEYLPGKHFRIYHAMMAGMALTLGWLTWVITHNPFLASSVTVYFPLGLDIAWWIRRYLDFTLPYKTLYVERWNWTLTLNLGREKAEQYYKEKNSWHQPLDWDAYGMPLWFGIYSWWIIFGAITAGLIVASFFF